MGAMADPEPRPAAAGPVGREGGDGTLRLFLALWPDAETLRDLLAWREGWRWPPHARLHAPKHLHLTLHFIGAVPAARLPELRRGLACPGPGFELRLTRAELWPGGLAMLCPAQTPPALARLHAGLADALRALELPVESRPFRPHLTLARKAAGALPPEVAPDLRWSVRGHVLAQSLGGYRILQRYPGGRSA